MGCGLWDSGIRVDVAGSCSWRGPTSSPSWSNQRGHSNETDKISNGILSAA